MKKYFRGSPKNVLQKLLFKLKKKRKKKTYSNSK